VRTARRDDLTRQNLQLRVGRAASAPCFCHALRVLRSQRFALSTALALAAALPARGADDSALVDGIAAQVDGRIVLVSEVMRAVRPQEREMRRAGAPEAEIAKLRAAGLERLIESRLIEKIVDETNLHVKDEEVKQAIEGIAKDNGLSLEQLYASVVFHEMSAEEYQAQIKRDLERRNLVSQMLGPRVKVADSEVEALYAERYGRQKAGGEAVHVRQILRALGGESQRSEETACAEAREAHRRVLSGEPFERVAQEVSEVAPRDGGDLGWLPLDSVAPWMSQALSGLSPGGISDVLVLPFGCAVLQLVERREVEPVTFASAKESLHRELFDRKLEQEYRQWIEEVRGHSYIERRGYFADAAQLGKSAFPGNQRGEPTATP
jgi:peptidyl-prolyl cis-trans isomerase SurA